MSRIKKLVMHGFKSFANRTEIPLGETFNVILGPNGSGKSNVLDAICFVLGRMSAKSMRVEKGSNLIFNGGKSKQAMDKAKVTIVFDNKEHHFNSEEKEVKISRIVKQNGQSIYKINDKRTTRTNVLELLGSAKINPEGYNIVLQGDVVKLIEMNSVQKRQLVEEISGISQYEEKKKKAESELEKVGEKINEANIILSERKSYLKELKKERDQALKYKNMKDEIDRNRATHIFMQLKNKEEELDKLNKDSEKLASQINSLNNAIKGYKNQILDNKKKAEKISKEIEERGEKEQVELNKELETLRVETEKAKLNLGNKQEDLERLASREENISKEIYDLKQQIERLKNDSASLEGKSQSKKKDLEKLKSEVSKIKKDNIEDIEKIESKIEEIETKTEHLTSKVQELREKQQNLLREKDKAEYDLQNIDSQIKKVDEIKKQHKKEMKELSSKKDEFKKYTLRLNTLLNDDSKESLKIGELKKKTLQIRERLEVLRIKNESAKRSNASNMAVQKLMEQRSTNKGIYGTVSELGSTQTKYSKALDSAAGGMLRYIIVDSDKTASDCIKYLKEKKLGFASFIPLNKIKPKGISPDLQSLKKVEGVIDFAINLINTSPAYKKAFRYILGNTLVVRDVNVARRIGIGRVRMVTLDGDIMEASGLMRGGFKKKSSSLGFKTEEFTKEIGELESELGKLNNQIRNLEQEKEKTESEIEELRRKKANLEGEIIKMEKSLYVSDEDLEANEDRKKELQESISKLEKDLSEINNTISKTNRELAQLKMDRQKLKDEIAKTKDPVKIAEVTTYEENIRNLERELMKIDSDLKLNMDKKDSQQKEIEELERTKKELAKDKKEINQQITKLKKRIEDNESKIKEKEKKVEEFYVEFKELFEKRNKIEKEIELLEKEIDKNNEELRKIEQKQNLLSLKKVQLEGEKTGLEKQMENYKDVEIIKDANEDKIKREIAKYEKMMEDIGVVNMKALEVYDNIQKEYDSFLEKKKTLEKERGDVLNLIQNLEQKKKDNFLKTYNVIKDNFNRIFSELFPKEGNAYLELEDEQDPFAGGMNIKVKLGTNRYQDLRGLSGGEKSMTALAFIFAIQEYEPASFYVLDEVDSALDKRNCEKLAQRIKRYSKKAQFVVISHNDVMISEADFLYGTSMNDPVSKIISLKL